MPLIGCDFWFLDCRHFALDLSICASSTYCWKVHMLDVCLVLQGCYVVVYTLRYTG